MAFRDDHARAERKRFDAILVKHGETTLRIPKPISLDARALLTVLAVVTGLLFVLALVLH